MLTSIVIASYNDGELLMKTVESVLDTFGSAGPEIIVTDDGSSDDGAQQCISRFPAVRLVRHRDRQGPSPSKDHAARLARGDVLIFLDAHCKPEPGALSRLVEQVCRRTQSVFVPQVPVLDVTSWTNNLAKSGCGAKLDLLAMRTPWAKQGELPVANGLVLSPGLIGCCAVMKRALYEELGGFDPDMRYWGAEDADFGLKVWLSGREVLCDPEIYVGHRFQTAFDHYVVPTEHVLANHMRMAYKNYSANTWRAWLNRRRAETTVANWEAGWSAFCEQRGSVEDERIQLLSKRIHDERWFAARFDLSWPPSE